MKQILISLLLGVEALAVSLKPETQHYLWENRVDALDRLCFTRSFTPPNGYTKSISGSGLVIGTRSLTFPTYDCTNPAIDSSEAAVTALFDVLESWGGQTLNDQPFEEEFRRLTYRSIFPSGCSFMCSQSIQRKNPYAFLKRGSVAIGSGATIKEMTIAEAFSQYGGEGRQKNWPMLAAAIVSWLRHPRLDEQEVNTMLDSVLNERAVQMKQDPTLRKYPDSWSGEPSIALLEHLESRGFVVLSLEKIVSRPQDGPVHKFNATVGCRTPHTEEEAIHLCCECIEYLQDRLPPLEETLAHRPSGLDPLDSVRWFETERVPINLVLNFPSNIPWDQHELLSAWLLGSGIGRPRIPPLSRLDHPNGGIISFRSLPPDFISEAFPKTRAYHQAYLEIERQERARTRPLKTEPLTPEELPL